MTRSTSVTFRKADESSMRTATQAAWGAWVVLSIGWLVTVAWVATVEPIDSSWPWVYVMTAVVPPGILLAAGAVLSWTARTFQRYASGIWSA